MTRLPLFMVMVWAFASIMTPFSAIAEDSVDVRARELLSRMTVEEKIGQLFQDDKVIIASDAMIREGRVGSFLNVTIPTEIDRLQHLAIEESRLGIPLIFGRDVIHGFRTVFPIPLGLASTWDADIVRQSAAASAAEAAAVGHNWTFSPMVDISRDPRWGRIAESFGEDPYLASILAVAMVQGYQTPQEGVPYGIAACVKHFAAYGATEGGRDYGTTPVPLRELRDVYLRGYEAASKAGAYTFMSAFNDLDGVPSTGNKFLLTEVLRNEWGFDGFVVSDWRSVAELIQHGVAADDREAAKIAINAGVDMEMSSTTYGDHLLELLKSGEVSEATLDERVLAILRIKMKLGLFDHPYREQGRENVILSPKHLELAYKAALESAVLLKNDMSLLPLKQGVKVAVVGPLADAAHEQLGTWVVDGRDADSVTPLKALRDKLGTDNVIYAPGLTYSRDTSTDGFAASIEASKAADVVLFFAGEESLLSGEAHCMADIRLPGAQEKLAHALVATGKPVVLIVMSGRQNVLTDIIDEIPAVLVAFHQGTMAGPALADLIFGDVSPSGRLPVSWPSAVGQIPIFYSHKNSGRPADKTRFTPIEQIPRNQLQSTMGFTNCYLDVPPTPAFPFGYGLTYGDFAYTDLALSSPEITADGELTASVTLTNNGKMEATEVVQLYVRDMYADVSRPVRELKGYQRVKLQAGESRKVIFVLKAADLNYTNLEMKRVIGRGEFKLWIAPNADSGLGSSFIVK